MNKRSKQLKTKCQNRKQRDRTNLSKSTMKASEKHIKNQNPKQSFSKGRKYIGGNQKLPDQKENARSGKGINLAQTKVDRAKKIIWEPKTPSGLNISGRQRTRQGKRRK